MSTYLSGESPASRQATQLSSRYGLENHGLTHLKRVYWNLPIPALVEEIIFRGEGHPTNLGAIVVDTGIHKKGAFEDRFIVKEPTTEHRIWWGETNRPFSWANFNLLLARVQSHLQGHDLFVQDAYVGSGSSYQIPVRIITRLAWHSLFARNMFLKPPDPEPLRTHIPDFTLIVAPSFLADPRRDGTRTEAFAVVNLAERLGLIGGTAYGGEIKRMIFSVSSFLLAQQDVLPMRCSANMGHDGDVALFFGLAGTGKTTLSSDMNRRLIGDDVHGWSDEGIFNFEGGCYPGVINLSAQEKPQIYYSTSRFGTILENVTFDPVLREIDLNDGSVTRNTRATFPLRYTDNIVPGYRAGHPSNIFLLTCDASGVMPPIARLSPAQAVYHYISGYTSRVPKGDPRGEGEPEIVFRSCFGVPFTVRHPYEYAAMFKRRLMNLNVNCWLLNTGWTRGPYGQGRRIDIRHSRALRDAALSGALLEVDYYRDPAFNFMVPTSCPGLPEELLHPEQTWADPDYCLQRCDALVARFIENFRLFEAGCPAEVADAGPRRPS